MAKKAIFKMAAAAILNFKNFNFGQWSVTGFNIWCSVPNFIKIGRFFTEIWRFNDFQNGGRRPSWILKICSFCHVSLVDMPFCFLIQNFVKIGQLVDELWPKNRFSRWRQPPSWILKISIFVHVTVIGFNICFSVPNFIKIGWFFTDIWWFSDLQNGGGPPSWICYEVTILLRGTHFRCPNIVLKFNVDRCYSFRDTCNIVSRPFWLYITDHGNFGVAHALYHVTLSLGVQITTRMKFLTPICLYTMPLLCVYDDD